jgi:hypothetical protein
MVNSNFVAIFVIFGLFVPAFLHSFFAEKLARIAAHGTLGITTIQNFSFMMTMWLQHKRQFAHC